MLHKFMRSKTGLFSLVILYKYNASWALSGASCASLQRCHLAQATFSEAPSEHFLLIRPFSIFLEIVAFILVVMFLHIVLLHLENS